MNGPGTAARLLPSCMRGGFVKLVSGLLQRSDVMPTDSRRVKADDPELIDQLIELGIVQPEVNECGGTRLSRQGIRLVEAMLREGVEKFFGDADVPVYDSNNRVLCWRGRIIKRWKREASNKHIVLAAFAEQNWQETIHDPIPLDRKQDRKERLRETVKSLNKRLQARTIRFFTTRDGSAIRWEPVRGMKEKRKTPR